MFEKSDVNTADNNLFDLVMSENVEFATINDPVLETAMSTMTSSVGK